jgi:hypothetical protein
MAPISKHALKQERMFALVAKFLESNLTQPAFCHTVPISLSTFQFWLSKYRNKARTTDNKSTATGSKSLFLPIPVPGTGRSNALATGEGCSIRFPNGVVVRFWGTLETNVILDLVHHRTDQDV